MKRMRKKWLIILLITATVSVIGSVTESKAEVPDMPKGPPRGGNGGQY